MASTSVGVTAASSRTVARDDDGSLSVVWTIALDRRGQGQVRFHDEARDTAYAREINGRSLEGAAHIDCTARQFQLDRLVIYPQPKLSGDPVLQLGSRPDWRTAEPDTTMARLMLAACGPDAGIHAPHVDAQRSRLATAEPVAANDAQPIPASPAKTREPRPPLTLAATEPIATRPTLAVVKPADAAVTSVKTVETIAKSEPPLAPPTAERYAPKMPSGAYSVQLASKMTADLADQAWREVLSARPAQLNGLPERVEVQFIRHVRYYRVLVGGLASEQAAQDLCKALGRRHADCWVRSDSSG